MMSQIKDETLFWKKKEFISFVLSILVFFIHISSIAQYPSSGNLISEVNETFSYFFKESLTRFAVPMFFILSGIAFFKEYDNKKYFKKIKSRIFTLVIPYLLWNTIWVIFETICSYSFISKFYVGRELFTLTFENIIKGIFFYECNLPFWFLFDLIIFSIAAPLIYFIIKNKYIGIIVTGMFAILSIYGIKIPESIFFSSNSIIFYMIGAIIGKHFFYYLLEKTSRNTQRISLVFFVVYVLMKNIFRTQITPFTPFLEVIIFTLSAFAIWSITDIFFDRISPRKIYSRSFAIFALHINVSAIITKIIWLVLPKSEWLAIPNFVLTSIITLMAIDIICIIMEKFSPKVYAILMGNRLKKQT